MNRILSIGLLLMLSFSSLSTLAEPIPLTCIYMYAAGGREMGIYVPTVKWNSQPQSVLWSDNLPSLHDAMTAFKNYYGNIGVDVKQAFLVESVALKAGNAVLGGNGRPERMYFLFSILEKDRDAGGGVKFIKYCAVIPGGEVFEAVPRKVGQLETKVGSGRDGEIDVQNSQ